MTVWLVAVAHGNFIDAAPATSPGQYLPVPLRDGIVCICDETEMGETATDVQGCARGQDETAQEDTQTGDRSGLTGTST